jgi:hypothetical protein
VKHPVLVDVLVVVDVDVGAEVVILVDANGVAGENGDVVVAEVVIPVKEVIVR